MPISSVERRNNLSYDEFVREYASLGKPVIITDVVKDWKAFKKWTLDFFRSEYGSIKTDVIDSNSKTRISMTIADYLDYMSACDRDQILYIDEWRISSTPALYEDYNVPVHFPDWLQRLPKKLLEKYHLNYSWLFIGPKDASIGLHTDPLNTSAWLALISGRKKFIFFTPDQQDFLYDGKVDAFNPNLEKFPLYANAKPIEVILEPGEIIYTPSKWWHHVKNLEDSIAVTHNGIDEWNSEIVFQSATEASSIKGLLLPLILEFPWLGRVLFATGLL